MTTSRPASMTQGMEIAEDWDSPETNEEIAAEFNKEDDMGDQTTGVELTADENVETERLAAKTAALNDAFEKYGFNEKKAYELTLAALQGGSLYA